MLRATVVVLPATGETTVVAATVVVLPATGTVTVLRATVVVLWKGPTGMAEQEVAGTVSVSVHVVVETDAAEQVVAPTVTVDP